MMDKPELEEEELYSSFDEFILALELNCEWYRRKKCDSFFIEENLKLKKQIWKLEKEIEKLKTEMEELNNEKTWWQYRYEAQVKNSKGDE